MRARLMTSVCAATLASASLTGAAIQTRAVDTLAPTGSVSPDLLGRIREAAACVETPDKRRLIFDARGQQVYDVNAAGTAMKPLIKIGPSDGEILRPEFFAYGANRTFTIVDVPGAYERVQTFYDDGTPIGVFRRWPTPNTATFSFDGFVFNGLNGAAAVGGHLLTQIATGASLMSELDAEGTVVREIGTLRATGHETDVLLHRALNAGVAAVAPDQSIFFVFTRGLPVFRKYAPDGRFVFERHIEGPELDEVIQTLPERWPMRAAGSREYPMVARTVVAAAADPAGNLWISLANGFTYVYDAGGNKTRTIRFTGAGPLTPTSLFFTRDGRVLATPGCFAFATAPASAETRRAGR